MLRIGLALADALAHAHERGVIHRDVQAAERDRARRAQLATRGREADGLRRCAPGRGRTRSHAPATWSARSPPWRPSRPPAAPSTSTPTSTRSGLVLYEALAGREPGGRGLATATARRIGTVLPPLAGAAPTHSRATCAPRWIARWLEPGQRGEARPVRRARRRARRSVRRGRADRAASARAPAAGAAARSGGWSPRPPPRRAGVGGARRARARVGRAAASPRLAAALVAVLPRLGWLVAAVGVRCCWCSGRPSDREPRCSWRRWLWPHRCCCAPTGARGRCRPWRRRSGCSGSQARIRRSRAARRGGAPAWRSARSAWWLVLAEPLLERALVFGPAPDTPARATFDGAVGITAGDVIAPRRELRRPAAGGDLGRRGAGPPVAHPLSLNADIVMATAWSAGTAAATIALGGAGRAGRAERAARPGARGGGRRRAGDRARARPPRGQSLFRWRRCHARAGDSSPLGTAAEPPPASEPDT